MVFTSQLLYNYVNIIYIFYFEVSVSFWLFCSAKTNTEELMCSAKWATLWDLRDPEGSSFIHPALNCCTSIMGSVSVFKLSRCKWHLSMSKSQFQISCLRVTHCAMSLISTFLGKSQTTFSYRIIPSTWIIPKFAFCIINCLKIT